MKCFRHPDYKAIYPPRVNCWICRDLFALKQAKKTERKKKTMINKTYKLRSPKGKVYTTNNLTKFASRFRNLTRTGLSKIANGHQLLHKGWRMAR